jgi:hypothetical protein
MFGGSPFARFGIINPGIPGDPGVDNDAYIGSTINNDFVVRINNTEAARFDTLLRLKIANIQNAITDTNQFLVSDSGVVKYRTGDELLSDIGAASSSSLNNYLPLTGGNITGSVNITGSLTINNSSVILSNQTSSMSVLSASYAENTTSSSYSLNATSASYVLNTTSASYAATSSFSNNFKINTTLDFAGTLTDYAVVNSSVVGLNNLFTQPTGSFTSAFFKYTVSNGTNTRAGEVIAAWNNSATEYTDFSTVDLGTTTAVTSSVSLVAGEIQFNIQTNSSGWKIKSIGTFI